MFEAMSLPMLGLKLIAFADAPSIVPQADHPVAARTAEEIWLMSTDRAAAWARMELLSTAQSIPSPFTVLDEAV
jgi:hypothetical protein